MQICISTANLLDFYAVVCYISPMKSYIHRTLEKTVKKAAQEFPVVLVTGPRQSGKTTLLQHIFQPTHRFVYLDEPDLRTLAVEDPHLFMAQNPPPIVFDEIQYAPELLNYIKRDVDHHRHDKGRYILSGSQSFPLMQGVSETLAGRISVLTLLSFSHAEKSFLPFANPFWKTDTELPQSEHSINGADFFSDMLRSGFPELVIEPSRDIRLWMSAYIQTYLERDIRNIRNIGSLTDFQRFLFALAARTSQLINISEIARDIGLTVNTVKAWFSILEASFQIVLLKPYYSNLGKRLVKSPKLYFLDPAIPAYLAGLEDAKHAFMGPMGGALFENAVFAEIYRAFIHRGEAPRIFFWRTAMGHEVDFILDFGTHLIPVEVKLSATPKKIFAKNLQKFGDLFPSLVHQSYLICLCSKSTYLTQNIIALPFQDIYPTTRSES